MSKDPDVALEALNAYRIARPEVRTLILAEAEKRVQTNVGRIDALNQRLSALCALLFAGAAVAATFSTNSDKVPTAAIYIASGSAVVFALGGAVGCFGLFSGQSIFPGEKPTWWSVPGLDALKNLSQDDAEGWLIERHEQMIASLGKAVARRGFAFNVAVVLGALAGALIAAAAVTTAALGPPAKPDPVSIVVWPS